MTELYYWTGFIVTWIFAILGVLLFNVILYWIFAKLLNKLTIAGGNLSIIIEYAYRRKAFKEWVKDKERLNKTSNLPTLEEYQNSKRIKNIYEVEQKRLYELDVEEFRKDLKEYFANNLIDGIHCISNFELRNNDIIPIIPTLEESYNGENDEDIKKISEHNNVDFKMIYWCYHK